MGDDAVSGTEAAPRARSRDDSRAEILAAAAECFMERGFAATSIDDVARRVGATKGRVYHYYDSKAELFFDVHREGMRLNFAAVTPAFQSEGSGLERLARMVRAHAHAMMDTLAFQRVSTWSVDTHRFDAETPAQQALLAELIALRDRYEALFRAVVQDGAADGSIITERPSLAVKAVLGALNWLPVWYRRRPGETRADREVIADTIVATVIGGLERRG